jgi:hypothetical protein
LESYHDYDDMYDDLFSPIDEPDMFE